MQCFAYADDAWQGLYPLGVEGGQQLSWDKRPFPASRLSVPGYWGAGCSSVNTMSA